MVDDGKKRDGALMLWEILSDDGRNMSDGCCHPGKT
jgi:hypothetical protein